MHIRPAARKLRDLWHGVRPLRVPPQLLARQAPLADPGALERSLRENYFTNAFQFPDPEYLSSEDGQSDLAAHMMGRLGRARSEVIPWLDAVVGIDGKRVLEVGCGTGASAVAFAEQGAKVIATDIDEGSMQVARDRLRAHGLNADLRLSNGLPDGECDMIVLYAVLEHMTLEERLTTLAAAWARLPSGGHMVLVETPNRLWYVDIHTSSDRFFMWLPDDLALLYAKNTPRPGFNQITTPIELTRWGRGVSFHDLAIGLNMPASALPVVSSMEFWLREQRRTTKAFGQSIHRRYENMLREVAGPIHPGFTTAMLDLVLRKP